MARTKSAQTLRKKPRQERSRATVDAILQAAAYILVRQGWAGLTTNAVARRAGVNIASLYQFFADKQSIVAELERRHVAETRAKGAEVFLLHRGQSLASRARTLVEAGIAAHRVQPELHRVFAERLPRDRHRGEPPFMLEGALRELGERGLPAPELTAWILRVATHAVVHEAVLERKADLDSGALADELVRMIVGYLEQPVR